MKTSFEDKFFPLFGSIIATLFFGFFAVVAATSVVPFYMFAWFYILALVSAFLTFKIITLK